MTSAISIKNLTYTYPNGTTALKNITLDISCGESVAILGPNGAGKSTLLLHLNGILTGKCDSFEIFGNSYSNNKDNHKVKEIIKQVGLVFQDPDDQLFMPTVFEDIAFGPMNMGLPESEIKKRVECALRKVNMIDKGYEHRCSQHLSYGEKKKISLASVLSMDPPIIAFDEPTANLDPKSRNDVIEIIKKLKSEGKTIIIATHDINAVSDLVDRIYVLNRTILGFGTTREIFLNTELLGAGNLNVYVPTLVEVLSCFGYNCTLPLTSDKITLNQNNITLSINISLRCLK